MSEADQQTTDVRTCARCGGDHDAVTFTRLTHPIDMEPGTPYFATHWAPCPTNGEPILLRAMPDDD